MLPEAAPLISCISQSKIPCAEYHRFGLRYSSEKCIPSSTVLRDSGKRLSASEESVTCDDLPKNKVKKMDCSNGSLRLLTNYYEPTTSRTKTEVL